MACNTKTINTTNVVTFGFTTSFDPYNTKVIISIAEETIFQPGGEANISNIALTITDPLNEEHTGTIDPSSSETEVEITGFSGASLFFGNYHVKGVLTEADASTYEIEFDINVCKPENMTAQNFIKGCLEVNVDCGRAVMEIYEKTKMLFNGKLPEKQNISYNGSITYPNNYLEQINNIDYLTYSLDLTDSITGMYQIAMVTTATFDLDCGSKLLIQYRTKVNQDVQCGAGMCDLNCCWADALEIVAKGGSKGAQMEDKMKLASYYFNAAVAMWSCGNNNEFFIQKVKEILNCDCVCDKSLLIQPRPITYGAKNLIPSCGTSISIDENGDYKFHSFVYVITPTDSKIKVNTVQTSECTKTTYISLDCAEVEKCIFDFLSDSDNEDILIQWQQLLNTASKCPCDDVEVTNSIELTEVITDLDMPLLADINFTRNEKITGLKYAVEIAVTGGTLQFAQYLETITGNVVQINTGAAQDIVMPCSLCANSVITNANTNKIYTNVFTTCGCIKNYETPETISKIELSERYFSANRFNAQIDDYPITTYSEVIDGITYTMQKLYFTDLQPGYNAIRATIFKTDNVGNTTLHETRTIIGAVPANLTDPTINNTWGNYVNIGRTFSLNLDMSEIVNGEPVIYFLNYTGFVCRAVRERSSECDERANWKVYVLASTGHLLIGMKKWFVDANNNQTFLFNDINTTKTYLLNFDNTGSKNDGSNWTTTDLLITSTNDFNLDLTKNYIFVFGPSIMKLVIYSGTNSLTQLQNPALYNEYVLCNNASASETSYIDGPGSTATLANPFVMQKVIVGLEERFYFSNESLDPTNNYIKYSYLRYMVYRGADPTLPDSWEFETEIVPSNNSILIDGSYNPGVSTNINGASQGMVYIQDLGWITMFIHGIKVIDFVAHTVVNFSGQAVANGDLDIQNDFMDTQFKIET